MLKQEGTQEEEVQAPKENSEEQTQEEQTINSEQATNVVASLLGEEQNSEEDSEQEQIEAEQAESPLVVIDDTLIGQFPTLKSLKGKSVKDLAQSYDGLARQLTKINQTVKQLKEREAKQANTQLGEAPDQVEDPAGFKKWQEKRDKWLKDQAVAEYQEESTRQQEAVEQINQALKKSLPKDMEPQDVLQDWINSNAYKWYDAMGQINQATQNYYAQNPDVFVQEVASHGKTMKARLDAEEAGKKNTKSVKLNAHQLAQNAYKNAKKSHSNPAENVNLVAREGEPTEAEALMTEIWNNISEIQSPAQ